MYSLADFQAAAPAVMDVYARAPTLSSYVASPSTDAMCTGVTPGECLPAQWWNYYLNKFTCTTNALYTYVGKITSQLQCAFTYYCSTAACNQCCACDNDLLRTLQCVYSNATAQTTNLCNTCFNGVNVRIGCNASVNNYYVGQIAIGQGAITTNNCAVAIGYASCAATSHNVALGDCAKAQSGTSIAIGYLSCTCGGGYSIAMGANSYAYGNWNVAIGAQACAYGACANNYGVAIGACTVAKCLSVSIGYQAGLANCSCEYLQTVAIGANANAGGNYGVGIGYRAQTGHFGDYNVAIGAYTLTSSGTGGCNAAIGINALRGVTSGVQNTGIGPNAGRCITTGCNNTAIGTNALLSATTTNMQVAIGTSALQNATTGSYNLAIGAYALCALTTGCENVVYGDDAGWQLTTGEGNTIMGNNTGMGLQCTSSYNTFMGKNINCITCDTAICYSTAIGACACVSGSYATVMGACAVGATNSVSVGRFASATTGSSIAVGACACACSVFSIAVGITSCATSTNSIAVGVSARSTSSASIAVGTSAYASNYSTIAVGSSACATSTSSIAVGPLARSAAQYSIAVGCNAQASLSSAIAIGCCACAGLVCGGCNFLTLASTYGSVRGFSIQATTLQSCVFCLLDNCLLTSSCRVPVMGYLVTGMKMIDSIVRVSSSEIHLDYNCSNQCTICCSCTSGLTGALRFLALT